MSAARSSSRFEHAAAPRLPALSHLAESQVTPRREGSLAISGVGFQIGRSGVWGLRPLALPRKRLNETKAQKVTPTYEPDLSLSFRICGPMPLLEVRAITQFPYPAGPG